MTISRGHRDPQPRRVARRTRSRRCARSAAHRRSNDRRATTVRSDATRRGRRAARGRGDVSLRRVYVPSRTAALARNAGVARRDRRVVLFVDDDVVLPPYFSPRTRARTPAAIGPHVVDRTDHQRAASPTCARCRRSLNGSQRVFLHLQRVGAARRARSGRRVRRIVRQVRLGGHRTRRCVCAGSACAGASSWEAYLWHIKPPATETLDAALAKTIEKARMAAQVRAQGSVAPREARDRRLRAQPLARRTDDAARWRKRGCAGVARSERVPAPLRARRARTRPRRRVRATS